MLYKTYYYINKQHTHTHTKTCEMRMHVILRDIKLSTNNQIAS